MIAIPAVDLKDGNAVQLVGGVPGSDRITLPDPVSVARRWCEAGFTMLHTVDLDAALGRGDNHEVVARIIEESGMQCQVGGGVRDDAAVRSLLDAGTTRVIVGTRAIEDPAWLEHAARQWPERLVVAADVRDGRIVTRGWTHDTGVDATAFIASLASLPLAAVLVTDVGREGRELGVDHELFGRIRGCTDLAIQAAGSIASIDDLNGLRDAGVDAAILGMALYTGTLDATTAAREFGQ